MNASGTKVVPLMSSGTAGPLGVKHLPRLWLKLTLGSRDMLADGYDFCGPGFDQMTLDALNLDKDETIAYVRDERPTYMQFERYVLEQNGGSVPREAIEKHNASLSGYNHSEELGMQMRSASGLESGDVRDAVTLNMVNDLDEFYASIER